MTLSACCRDEVIKPDQSLLEPAQKNELTPESTVRDLYIENEFRGKEIDKVNLNLQTIQDL